MANTIVALYDDLDTAHKVIRDLRDAGIPNSSISLVAQDASGQYSKNMGTTGRETGDGGDGAATGAGVGAVVGGIGGLLVGLGALTIPGIGPVLAAGPLSTAMAALLGAGAGAVAGGVAGGLLGALIDMGIPEEQAGYYAEGVRRGGILVTVDADDDMALERARDVMNRHNPVDINQRVESWRQAGWKGYSGEARAYNEQETLKERETWTTMGNVPGSNISQGRGGVQTYPRRTERMGGQTMDDMERYRTGWRGHYQSQFGRSGNKYEHYEPAYQYGHTLRNEPRYRDYDWDRLEPEARRTWEERNPGTAWDEVRAAVLYSWENQRQSTRD